MAWVRMIETDRHQDRAQGRGRCTRYAAGKAYRVKRTVCDELVARGTAAEIRAPRRRPAPDAGQ